MCEDVGVTGGEAGGRCSGNGGLRCERMQGDAAACDPLSLLKYVAWHNVCAELKLGGLGIPRLGEKKVHNYLALLITILDKNIMKGSI